MRPVLAFAAFVLFASPVLAQQDHSGHGRPEQGAHAMISQERAQTIAAQQGVARVREIELRRGLWKIEGTTEQGRPIEVEIDAHSGVVTKREIG